MDKLAVLVVLLSTPCFAQTATVSVRVNTTHVNTLDARYVSANFDWHLNSEEYPAWVNSSVLLINLTNPDLMFLASSLSPAYLRVGGSEGDQVTYETPNRPCPAVGNFCLTMQRWDEINAFAAKTNLTIAFGLNAMNGRANSSSPMNISNLAEFLAYTAGRPNYTNIGVFEFGNELENTIDASVYAADLLRVADVIQQRWAGRHQHVPGLVANDENPNPAYWQTLLPAVGQKLTAATWHLYVGYGLDPTLPQQAWNRTFLDDIDVQADPMVDTAAAVGFSTNASKALWIGETAMAWHSGQNGTTNTFLSGPWYVAQLGKLAHTHRVQCRQTLYGGYYELINKWDYTPNPDWWTAMLWKRTMGSDVLALPQVNDSSVYAFAHCSARGATAPPGAVTLAYVNLEATITASVVIPGIGASPRDEYVLTAGQNEASRKIYLNGALLEYSGNGVMSPLRPKHVSDPSMPLLLPPHSYGFIVLQNAGVAACM